MNGINGQPNRNTLKCDFIHNKTNVFTYLTTILQSVICICIYTSIYSISQYTIFEVHTSVNLTFKSHVLLLKQSVPLNTSLKPQKKYIYYELRATQAPVPLAQMNCLVEIFCQQPIVVTQGQWKTTWINELLYTRLNVQFPNMFMSLTAKVVQKNGWTAESTGIEKWMTSRDTDLFTGYKLPPLTTWQRTGLSFKATWDNTCFDLAPSRISGT